MRLIHAAAAFGLLVGHALGQQWEDMGVMPDLSRRVFYEAFAHPPSLAKRDGDCAGGGCCDSGYSCTVVSSTPMCAKASSASTATNTAIPTASGVTVEHIPSSGLSTGAKAGIAVGVIVGAALITGVLTWLCIRRRRRTGRSTTTGQELDSGVGAPRGPNANGGAHAYPDGGPLGPQQHMSEAGEYGYAPSSTQVSYSSRAAPGPLPGLASDYFGAAAARGPYTDRDGEQATTPEYLARPVRGEGQSPHGPDDVVGPVEIGAGGSVKRERDGFGRPRLPSHAGSSEGSELDGIMVGPNRRPSQQQQQQQQQAHQQATPVRESIAERFELYGSEAVPVRGARDRDANRQRAPQPLATPGSEVTASELGTPSPMSHEEQQRQQQQQQDEQQRQQQEQHRKAD
ncbi:hypothetical protein SLS53_006299 [Cytospora paraplurivora]|uniref:Uncharacterized protein n=1 Tax=Cytospora paraplurivora TaxID=2898453 RepID=A0AAN9YFA2_9PEZI